MTEENNRVQDPFDIYGYKSGQEILIKAEFLIGVLSFCKRVEDQQPPVAVLKKIPKVNKINDKKNDDLIRVDYEWEEFPSKISLANTIFNKESAAPIMTQLGLMSFQIQSILYDIHEENILNNIAVKIDDNDATQST